VVGGIIIALASAARSDHTAYGEGAIGLLIIANLVLFVVFPVGFASSLIIVSTLETRANRRKRMPSNAARAILGRATLATVIGGLVAVLLVATCLAAGILSGPRVDARTGMFRTAQSRTAIATG
jgi:hypothetical protein